MHRIVTELFVLDIYLCIFLEFKSIHEHGQYIDICFCLLLLLSYMAFSSVLFFLLSIHSVDCAYFIVRSPH